MTAKTIHKLMACVVVAASVSSCTLLTKSNVIRADKPKATASGNKQHTVSTPAPSTKEQEQAPTRHATSRDYDGEWTIVQVKGMDVHLDTDMPYMNLAGAEGRFYASNGCNILNGDFSTNANAITFSNVLSTMMLCPDARLEQAVNSVIKDGATVYASIYGKGDESYLNFTDMAGNTVMKLRKHNLERLNGEWDVTAIGEEKTDGETPDIFIDVAERSIHGNTGCNYFNGTIECDSDKANSISFSGMSVSRRACENADTERAMLVALEETVSYKLAGNDLTFFSSRGKPLMKLHRVKIDK